MTGELEKLKQEIEHLRKRLEDSEREKKAIAEESIAVLGKVGEATKERMESEDRLKERTRKLEDSRTAMIYMMRDLKRATTELEKKIRDLETFQRITMDREKRIIELKKEIKELKKQLESKKE